MPVAFNPPPFPTADTTLAAPVDANADASIPPDAFSQLLLAAGGDASAMTGADARDALAKGRLAELRGLRGLTDTSLRLATDGKSAAAMLGARDAREALDASAAAVAGEARTRAEDEVPVDADAIVAAFNAALASTPKAEAPDARVTESMTEDAGEGEDRTAGQAIPDATLAAIPASATDVALQAMAAHADVRNASTVVPSTSRADKMSGADRAPIAGARATDAATPSKHAGETIAAQTLPATRELPHATPQGVRTRTESMEMPATASSAIPVPASDASSAVATAKELLGDSVNKLKEVLERSGSSVSAQALAAPQPALATSPASVQTIETPVGAAGFDNEFAGKLSQVVMLRHGSAEFHLHPAELGPVDVQISFASDQAVVLITAPQAATRDALEQTLPYLRDMLAEQGIALGQATVQGERNPSDQGRPERQDAGQAGPGGPRATEEIAARPARIRGLVDVFA